jgi:hypothetical protein
MMASDAVTANPFAKPLVPSLGKMMMRPVASMASPATTATRESKASSHPSFVTRRLLIPRVGSDWQLPQIIHRASRHVRFAAYNALKAGTRLRLIVPNAEMKRRGDRL